MIFENRINKKIHDKNKLRMQIFKNLLNNKYHDIYNLDLKVQSIYLAY